MSQDELPILWFIPDVFYNSFDAGNGCFDVEKLSITDELKGEIIELEQQFSRIDNDELKNDNLEKLDWLLFDLEGIRLWKKLREELKGKYKVTFYSHYCGDHFFCPEELEALLKGKDRTQIPPNRR